MDIQSDIDLAGAVLPVLAAVVPGLAQAQGAITLASDGIKIEQGFYKWFESPQGAQTRANVTKLFGDLGVKVGFGSEGHVTVARDESRNPWSTGYVIGSEGGGE